MRATVAALAVGVLLPPLASVSPAAARTETLVAEEPSSRVIVVRDVTTRHGVVNGVLVNHSRKLLRDVRLLFHHTWYWRDELHPGDDSPGRVEYYTVRSEIPPTEDVEFTYHPEPSLPERPDGHFETTVDVVGWTEIGR